MAEVEVTADMVLEFVNGAAAAFLVLIDHLDRRQTANKSELAASMRDIVKELPPASGVRLFLDVVASQVERPSDAAHRPPSLRLIPGGKPED